MNENFDEVRTAKRVEEITRLREQFGYAEDEFLRRRGWSHTSSTPGCYWMWQREIDGIVYSVSKARALSIEEVEDSHAAIACTEDAPCGDCDECSP